MEIAFQHQLNDQLLRSEKRRTIIVICFFVFAMLYRLIDMTLAETHSSRRAPTPKSVETLLFDPGQIPQFRSWRTDKFRQ